MKNWIKRLLGNIPRVRLSDKARKFVAADKKHRIIKVLDNKGNWVVASKEFTETVNRINESLKRKQ